MQNNIHWKDWCWSWNSSTLATSCEELTHLRRLWCWEGLGAGGEGDARGWDGWMASLTRCTWVWVNSGSWWWTGRPGVLQFMGLQRVGHNWVTEWTELLLHAGRFSITWATKKALYRYIGIGKCINIYVYIFAECLHHFVFPQQCMSVPVAPYCCFGILNYCDVSHHIPRIYDCISVGFFKNFNLFKLKTCKIISPISLTSPASPHLW